MKMFSHLTSPRFLVPSSLLLSKIQWRVDDRCWINLCSRHVYSKFGCGAADTEEHTLVGIGWKISSGLPTGHVQVCSELHMSGFLLSFGISTCVLCVIRKWPIVTGQPSSTSPDSACFDFLSFWTRNKKIFLKAVSCKAALGTCPHGWKDHGISHFLQLFQDRAGLRVLEWPCLTICYDHTITIFF